jgi:hypothetical protein
LASNQEVGGSSPSGRARIASGGPPAGMLDCPGGSGVRTMKKRPTREPYERPKVVRVKIVSGEMAVTGCKVRNGNTGPTLGCQRTACRSIGS